MSKRKQEEARATEPTDFMDLILGFIHPILPPNVEEEQEVPQEPPPPVPTAENVEIAPVADVAAIPGAAVLTTNVEMQEAAEEPPTLTTENVETAPAAGVPVIPEVAVLTTNVEEEPPASTTTENVEIAPGGSGEATGVSENAPVNKQRRRKRWTEWAFAAFVFDSGPCSVRTHILR